MHMHKIFFLQKVYEVQLTLEQHRFELHSSTDMQRFFFNTYIGKIFGDFLTAMKQSYAPSLLSVHELLHLQVHMSFFFTLYF